MKIRRHIPSMSINALRVSYKLECVTQREETCYEHNEVIIIGFIISDILCTTVTLHAVHVLITAIFAFRSKCTHKVAQFLEVRTTTKQEE